MFSSVSFGEWTKVGITPIGSFYVDLERIRIQNGFRYNWGLYDYLEPDKNGHLSVLSYNKIDCNEFRTKTLQGIFYTQAMGKGSGKKATPSEIEWDYPPPNSMLETMTKKVCEKEISTQ